MRREISTYKRRREKREERREGANEEYGKTGFYR